MNIIEVTGLQKLASSQIREGPLPWKGFLFISYFCVGKSLPQLTVVNKVFDFEMPVDHNPALADISGGFVSFFCTVGFLREN